MENTTKLKSIKGKHSHTKETCQNAIDRESSSIKTGRNSLCQSSWQLNLRHPLGSAL